MPIRLGGCGFISSKTTRKAAYIGSIAIAAMVGTLSPSLKNDASTSPWPSYLQFIQSFKTNPHLRLQEDLHLFGSSAPKLQALIEGREPK
jgi:hypothetical protein